MKKEGNNSRLRFWLIFAIVLLLALSAITVGYYWHRIFPSEKVSEVYTRYRDCEGLNVSFVEAYRINDSVTVDVTLIEVSDSVMWDSVCADFGIIKLSEIPEEMRPIFSQTNAYGYHYVDLDSTLLAQSDRGDVGDGELRDVCLFSRGTKTVCVFHCVDNVTLANIVDKKMDEIGGGDM